MKTSFGQIIPVLWLISYVGQSHANPILSVVPTTVGLGGQSYVSTIPGVAGSQLLTANNFGQYQLVRQPSGVVSLGGGLTQVVVPGQQSLFNGAGVVPYVTTGGVSGIVNPAGLTTTNGLGVTTTSGVQYPYTNNGLTAINLNGVPMLLSSSGLNSGLQTVNTLLPQVGGSSIVSPYITQPVVREVAEVQEVETPAVVQLDPMDAALLDMENKGQIHMEKYAWGRSSHQNKVKPSNSDNENGFRSDLPHFYSPLPAGSIISSQPVDLVNQSRIVAGAQSPTTQSQLRNPFVDANGKRKKHFEFYQYFRNLNMNSPQTVIPVAVIPSADE